MGTARTLQRLRFLIAIIVCALPCAAGEPAQDELAGIMRLLGSGETEEAHCRLSESLRRAQHTNDRGREAVVALHLAMAELGRGNAGAARAAFAIAEERYEALGDHLGRWLTNWSSAELERMEGQFDAAAARHEQALAALHDAASAPFSLDSMKVMARMHGLDLGQFPLPLESMSELLTPFLLRFIEAMQRDAYAAFLIEVGQLDRAEEELAAAAELVTMFPGVLDASLSIHRGDLQRRRWRLDEARESYRAALGQLGIVSALFGSAHALELRILDRLQEVERLAGRLDNGLEWNDRALLLARNANDSRRQASILDTRASLLLHGGRTAAAEASLLEALALAEKNGHRFQHASVLASLASLYKLRGRYGKAAEQMEKSLEIYRTLDMAYVEAPTWVGLAEIYYLLDDAATAATALAKGRDAAKRANFPLAAELANVVETVGKGAPGTSLGAALPAKVDEWLRHPGADGLLTDDLLALLRTAAAVYASPDDRAFAPVPSMIHTPGTIEIAPVLLAFVRGRASFGRGDFGAARAAWSEALRTNPGPDLRAGLLALTGATFWREGRDEEGTRYFLEAVNSLELTVEDVRAEELIGSYLGNLRHAYFDLLIANLLKQGKAAAAFDLTERARARAFLQLVGKAPVASARDSEAPLVLEAEALRAQITAWQRDASRAFSGAFRTELEDARARYAALLTRVKTAHPEYASVSGIDPVRLDTLQHDLPQGTTLVSYFVTTAGVHAWVIGAASVHHVQLPIDAAALASIVCWSNELGPRTNTRGIRPLGDACEASISAEDAYDLLFAPVRPKISTDRLLIVPHNVLHFVPFAALRDRRSNRYLVEDYTISHAPSSSAVRFLRRKESDCRGAALVLGDPDAVEGKLPGANEEAEAVARRLGTNALTGSRATESALRRLAGSVDVIHVAAHGFYDPRNPLFSYIALAADGGDDGRVEVNEILRDLDLSGVNLVVLSACESGLGKGSRGDDIAGLTRALLYAGTPGVISTLWQISDEKSTALMARFYARFVAGEFAADALRAAQLSSIARAEEPRYWAAFTLTGDPRGRWPRAREEAARE